MSVERSEVRRIIRLARLKVSETELDQLAEDLNRILEHMRVLASHDPTGSALEELASPGGARPGSEPDALAREPAAFAPDWRDPFFVVPVPPGVLPARHRGEDPDRS